MLSRDGSEKVAGHVFYGCEIGRCVLFSDAALIIAEDHVQDPMEAVFDAPVASDRAGDKGGIRRQGGDIESGLAAHPLGGFASALDHDDGLEVGPFLVALAEPFDSAADPIAAGLDPAERILQGLMVRQCGVGEIARTLVVEKELDNVGMGARIAVKHEQVGGILGEDQGAEIGLVHQ